MAFLTFGSGDSFGSGGGYIICYHGQEIICVTSPLLTVGEPFYGETVSVESEAAYHAAAGACKEAMVAVFFPGEDVADMDFYGWSGNRQECVVQCYAGMAVTARIDDDAVVRKAHCLNLADKFAFDIGLKVFDVNLWIPFSEDSQFLFHGSGAIDVGLTCADEVEIGSVDDDNLHNVWFCDIRVKKNTSREKLIKEHELHESYEWAEPQCAIHFFSRVVFLIYKKRLRLKGRPSRRNPC